MRMRMSRVDTWYGHTMAHGFVGIVHMLHFPAVTCCWIVFADAILLVSADGRHARVPCFAHIWGALSPPFLM